MPTFGFRVTKNGATLRVGMVKNQLTNVALEAWLGRCLDGFQASSNPGTWKVGGISGDGYSTRSRNDTWASHAGWVALSAEEQDFSFDTAGWNSTAEALGFGGTADGQLTLNDGDVLKGFYLRNSTGSILWSTAELQTPVIASGTTLVDIYYYINDGVVV